MRVSKPVRSSISFSSVTAMPPRRTWPNASVCCVLGDDVAVLGRRALGDDDDRERPAAALAAAQVLADLLDVERALGHEDRVGAAGHAGVHGDPAGVAAHDLADDHAVVRLGGGVQAVDRVGGDLHGGLEAERVVGAGEVVVDRLRHADDVDAVVGQPLGHAERVLAADRDQPVEAVLLERGARPSRSRPPPCTGSCARCRGSCRRGAGCRGSSRASAPSRRRTSRRPSRSGSRGTRGRRR